MDVLNSVAAWLAQLTKIVLVLIPLAVVLHILFGELDAIGVDVISNLIGILKHFGDNGLVGLIALGIVAWIFAATSDVAKSSN